MKHPRGILWIFCAVGLLAASPANSRPGFKFPVNGKGPAARSAQELPNVGLEVHKINRMALAITNNGFFGTGYLGMVPIDPETGRTTLACEYPINSDIEYLWVGSLWIGAVVGRDTLVTTGAEGYYYIVELWPAAGEDGAIIRRSTLPFSPYYSPDAVSEEDIVCVYSDTITDPNITGQDPIDNRRHIPLNVEVTQRSYAWSYPYAEDFILFDFDIKNNNQFPLKQLYIGVLVDADAYHISKSGGEGSWLDDICGYRDTLTSPIWPGTVDSIRVAWVADNDGDPQGQIFDFTSPTALTATRVIRTPSDSLRYSFNWWVTNYSPTLDWGPRRFGTEDAPYRDFGANFGTPLGDRNKYYVMSSREFDYDQLECALSHTGDGWLPPPNDADIYADGHNSIYLFSFGPFDVAPDSTLPVTLAYIGGENFHHDPTAFSRLYDPYNPRPYQNQLDFTDVGLNSVWADWVYDNPGYDTDNDGDSGLAKWFYYDSGDSIYAYYKGDGVPDFRGAAPPPPPALRVTTDYGRLIIRWNGQITENFVDPFSGTADFEGYRIYYAEDKRSSDFVLLHSYDRNDYNRFRWDETLLRWEISTQPLFLDSLRRLYGDDFDPTLYSSEDRPFGPDDPGNPGDAFYYFTPQDWNQSDLSDPHGIHRIYPEADPHDPADTTEEGYLRYYEYEYIIDGLPASRGIWVSVTAFDYGSRAFALTTLESSPLLNAVFAWPQQSASVVEKEGFGVYVYPNPYRIDGGYARKGFENRDRTRSAERARRIHFANLPHHCTIRIFTVDGDLVKQIDHSYPEGDPEAMHESWDLITRNTQAAETGIYLYVVTSAMGEQIGKFVIIK